MGSQAEGMRGMEQAPPRAALLWKALRRAGSSVQLGFGQKRPVEGKSDGRRSSIEGLEAEN